jgi:hypothetical protein
MKWENKCVDETGIYQIKYKSVFQFSFLHLFLVHLLRIINSKMESVLLSSFCRLNHMNVYLFKTKNVKPI